MVYAATENYLAASNNRTKDWMHIGSAVQKPLS